MAVVMQSAVRVPSPEPDSSPPRPSDSYASNRKRSSTSRSPSPTRQAPHLRRRSPSSPEKTNNRPRPINGQHDPAPPTRALTAEEKQAAAKAEYQKLLTMRSGGTYVPPARLRALQAEIGNDPQSPEFQRMAWEALKKSINGLINKVNVSNIKYIVPELFGENLIRGRGLFCRSIMKAQAASLPFTPIYATMAAIVNTKLPQVGELLVHRLIVQFRKAYRRNDKSVCLSSTTFLAHLINQQVLYEMTAAQILLLLLNKPTDDSVEIAVGLMKEVGSHLEERQAAIAGLIFDQFRNILHEADIDKRIQYMIEVLFQIRKDGYKDNPALKEELDLVEEEDQLTHKPGDLDGQLDVLDSLNIFKFDPQWEEHEEAYRNVKAEILGEADGSDEDDGEEGDESSEEDETDKQQRAVEIKDQTNTDLVNLRRTIYLTIMSSGGFEECTHKLLRINLPQGLEHEMPSMLVECASQERTFSKFFGLIGERLCKLNRMWTELFEAQFAKYYDTIHRFETNRLRIIAQFFAHMLASDAIGWHVMSAVHLNEEETTSSSRIFIKILFEDLSQAMGMKKLQERMLEPGLQSSLLSIFPIDNPKNTRFSINFFTAIGMGALTETMREWLKNMPKPAMPALPAKAASLSSRSRSSSRSSYSSYSSRSRSPSRSPSRDRTRNRGRGAGYSRSRSPRPRNRRARSYSSSRSPSVSRSPPPRRATSRRNTRQRSYSQSRSPSLSRSPAPRRRPVHSVSRSRSPSSRRTNARTTYSRSPPPPRRSTRPRSYSASRSPPPRHKAPRSLSRSPPPRRRRRSYSRSPSRSSRSRQRRPRHESRSPSRRRQSRSESRRATAAVPITTTTQNVASKDDQDAIHPSRRNLVAAAGGGARGVPGGRRDRARPLAGDFM